MAANAFTIFAPGQGPNPNRPDGGVARARSEIDALRLELNIAQRELALLRQEPMITATVVELRKGESEGDLGRMSVSPGGAGTIDINAIAGVRVGDRVLCHRQTMQASSILRDDVPTGTIVTALRQVGNTVEADVMGTLRAFRSMPGVEVRTGERIIVDPGMTFVIGTLGMPPQTYAHMPTVNVSWDDIGGHVLAKAALREAIELPYSHAALFAGYGKRPVRGVLLSGPSGTGKNMLAMAAATSIARAHGKAHAEGFVYVKGPELLNAYIGKTEEAIRRLFSAARTHFAAHGYPAVIFLDECDALLGVRDRGIGASINATTVPQFLAEMDGLDSQATMLILATNRPDTLDPAVVREGRIDRRVRIGRPSVEDAREIFRIHLRNRPIASSDSASQLVDLAANCTAALYDDAHVIRQLAHPSFPDGQLTLRLRDFASGAMIAGIVEQATTAAMMRDIDRSAPTATGLTLDDLRWATDRARVALANVNHAEAITELVELQQQQKKEA